jgi:hypothetical protein
VIASEGVMEDLSCACGWVVGKACGAVMDQALEEKALVGKASDFQYLRWWYGVCTVRFLES